MATNTASDINELNDPSLRLIAARIVRELELSAEKVAANHGADEDPCVQHQLLQGRCDEDSCASPPLQLL